MIYKATVTDEDNNVSTYTGLTRNSFKSRYNGHKYTFSHRDASSTTLSTHLWKLKDKNKQYNVNWKLIDRAPDFNPITRKCRLCLKEKFYIIFQPEGASLNTRSELYSTCRHRLRLLLRNTWAKFSIWYRTNYFLSILSLVKCLWRLWSTLWSYETICKTYANKYFVTCQYCVLPIVRLN